MLNVLDAPTLSPTGVDGLVESIVSASAKETILKMSNAKANTLMYLIFPL
jgi:hypothetical protein